MIHQAPPISRQMSHSGWPTRFFKPAHCHQLSMFAAHVGQQHYRLMDNSLITEPDNSSSLRENPWEHSADPLPGASLSRICLAPPGDSLVTGWWMMTTGPCRGMTINAPNRGKLYLNIRIYQLIQLIVGTINREWTLIGIIDQ